MRAVTLPIAIAALTIAEAPAAFAAQSVFPEKPIRMIIDSAPRSGPDIMATIVADHLHGVWNSA